MNTTPRPITPTVTYHRDTDTLSVSLRHREAEGVSSVTSSYMTQLEMSPAKWRAYVAAVLAELNQLEAAGAGGKSSKTNTLLVIGDSPEKWPNAEILLGSTPDLAELADRIAEHAAAT